MAKLNRKEVPEELEKEEVMIGISNPWAIPIMVPQESVDALVQMYQEGDELALTALVIYLQCRSWKFKRVAWNDEILCTIFKINKEELDHVVSVLDTLKFY